MHYGEDKYIGYRGLDTTNCPVAYPFGHGLSYTNFAYPGLDLAICPVTESTGQDKPCLLYTSPSPRDLSTSRMPSSA